MYLHEVRESICLGWGVKTQTRCMRACACARRGSARARRRVFIILIDPSFDLRTIICGGAWCEVVEYSVRFVNLAVLAPTTENNYGRPPAWSVFCDDGGEARVCLLKRLGSHSSEFSGGRPRPQSRQRCRPEGRAALPSAPCGRLQD